MRIQGPGAVSPTAALIAGAVLVTDLVAVAYAYVGIALSMFPEDGLIYAVLDTLPVGKATDAPPVVIDKPLGDLAVREAYYAPENALLLTMLAVGLCVAVGAVVILLGRPASWVLGSVVIATGLFVVTAGFAAPDLKTWAEGRLIASEHLPTSDAAAERAGVSYVVDEPSHDTNQGMVGAGAAITLVGVHLLYLRRVARPRAVTLPPKGPARPVSGELATE